MSDADRVVVVGAGPVGLVIALGLTSAGIPVTLLEQEPGLTRDLRAGSYHPPTLEMMAPYGITEKMLEVGIKVPDWQLRDREHPDWVANFNLRLLSDITPYPFRLHLQQHELMPIIRDLLLKQPLVDIRFGAKFTTMTQDDDVVHASFITDGVETNGVEETIDCRWLIGADGARSNVRKSAEIPFEGYTWPERFFVISTMHDYARDGYAMNAYIADPDEWATLFKMPGGPLGTGYWRVVFPVDVDTPEAVFQEPASMEARLQSFVKTDTPYEILYSSFYRVHQRVAETFRKGRVLLAGDAAHLNNPLGAMGLNSGIHDASNLIGKLTQVWRGEAGDALLDVYSRQRQTITNDFVQQQSIRNKRTIEERDPELRRKNFEELVHTANTPELAREYLIKSSMIAGVRRAAEVA